jgi:hypothetical protein
MQPVNTGRSVVGRHDGSDDLLSLGDCSWSWIRYLYIFQSKRSRSLFVQAVLGLESGPLLLFSVFGGMTLFERVS